jgi:hypothetical protein
MTGVVRASWEYFRIPADRQILNEIGVREAEGRGFLRCVGLEVLGPGMPKLLDLEPGTAREYRRNVRRIILPALGHIKVADVTRADISKFHHDLHHIPYQANRNLEVISKMFGLAEMWGMRPDG